MKVLLFIVSFKNKLKTNVIPYRFKVKAANGVTVVLAGINDISKPPFYEVNFYFIHLDHINP